MEKEFHFLPGAERCGCIDSGIEGEWYTGGGDPPDPEQELRAAFQKKNGRACEVHRENPGGGNQL